MTVLDGDGRRYTTRYTLGADNVAIGDDYERALRRKERRALRERELVALEQIAAAMQRRQRGVRDEA